MGMLMDTSLGFLLERLHWPVPRVRWEAARSLASLVRAGADGVLDALTRWNAERTLESECLLGVGVIHAFDLAEFCPEDTARRAVSRPSLASEWMLNTVYDTREPSAPFRVAVSPPLPTRLDENAAAIFDRYNTMAVPPVFLHTLDQLEDALNFPFEDRWRHDWAWICRSHGVQAPEPGFFLGSGTGRGGTLHMPLGEMLVSAYLRTLAYAMHMGTLGEDQAEYHAMLALPMNRGLAALEPMERPAWSRNLMQRWRDSGRVLAQELWAQAARSARPGELPAALRLVEGDEQDFIEVEIDRVVGQGAFDTGEPQAVSPKYEWDAAEPGRMEGDIRLRGRALGPLAEPMTSACLVAPVHVGRIDGAVALQVKLACLGLGGRRGRVCCGANDVELQVGNEVVSRWHHWYAEWEPSKFSQRYSDVSSMTTVGGSWLRAYAEPSGLSEALLVRVRIGTREHTHQNHVVEVDEFWSKP